MSALLTVEESGKLCSSFSETKAKANLLDFNTRAMLGYYLCICLYLFKKKKNSKAFGVYASDSTSVWFCANHSFSTLVDHTGKSIH